MMQAIGTGCFDPDASRSVVLGGLVAAAGRGLQCHSPDVTIPEVAVVNVASPKSPVAVDAEEM
eukprot:417315-Amphidinium_carterae.1